MELNIFLMLVLMMPQVCFAHSNFVLAIWRHGCPAKLDRHQNKHKDDENAPHAPEYSRRSRRPASGINSPSLAGGGLPITAPGLAPWSGLRLHLYL